jgi:hypothetical protein
MPSAGVFIFHALFFTMAAFNPATQCARVHARKKLWQRERKPPMNLDPQELRSILDNLKTHEADTKASEQHDTEGAMRIIAALERIPHVTTPDDTPIAAPDGAATAAELAIARTIAAVDDGIAKIKTDDFSALETMLAGQALALEVIFNEYVKRASRTNYRAPTHMFLSFALRAQSQCRITAQSLAQLRARRPLRSAKAAEADANATAP